MTRVEDSLGILERLSFPNTATEAYIPCSLDTLIYAPGKHAFKSPGNFQNFAHRRSRDHVPVSHVEIFGAPSPLGITTQSAESHWLALGLETINSPCTRYLGKYGVRSCQ